MFLLWVTFIWHKLWKVITPYGVKKGSLCKKSKILLEKEYNLLKVTQLWVDFTPFRVIFTPYGVIIFYSVLHTVYKVIKSGNEWHAGVDRRGFGIKQDFIPLFFFMYKFLSHGQKAILTICRIWFFFDIFYSKFHLVSTFSICSKCCVENWLLLLWPELQVSNM